MNNHPYTQRLIVGVDCDRSLTRFVVSRKRFHFATQDQADFGSGLVKRPAIRVSPAHPSRIESKRMANRPIIDVVRELFRNGMSSILLVAIAMLGSRETSAEVERPVIEFESLSCVNDIREMRPIEVWCGYPAFHVSVFESGQILFDGRGSPSSNDPRAYSREKRRISGTIDRNEVQKLQAKLEELDFLDIQDYKQVGLWPSAYLAMKVKGEVKGRRHSVSLALSAYETKCGAGEDIMVFIRNLLMVTNIRQWACNQGDVECFPTDPKQYPEGVGR